MNDPNFNLVIETNNLEEAFILMHDTNNTTSGFINEAMPRKQLEINIDKNENNV